MKTKLKLPQLAGILRWAVLMPALWGLTGAWQAKAVGSWVPVAFPYSNPGHMLLLSDGSVMVQNGTGQGWYCLKPDGQGQYVNGYWSTLTGMHDTRDYYSADVLKDGRVFVAGGEHGSGSNTAEIFNPLDNGGAGSWTYLNPPPSVFNPNIEQFEDSDSVVLANGDVLVAPVNVGMYSSTLIYDPFANSWTTGSRDRFHWQNEATWVKLPDDSILTVDLKDTGGLTSERFIPSLNEWITDADLPVSTMGGATETGGALMMPGGNAFFLGGSGHTVFYTPSGNTNHGTWLQGPDMPYFSGTIWYYDASNNLTNETYNGLLKAQDTPAAMMVNGHILCQISRDVFHTPVWFYEYDPSTASFVAAPCPTNSAPGSMFWPASTKTDATYMLDLPDGNVLYSDGGALYIYQPGSGPIASAKPVINGVGWNQDGSVHLSGRLFNGFCQGVSYGDDAQMDSNYPLVRFTDGSGKVVYARTYNWSSTGVATGNQTVTTEAVLPQNIQDAPGIYSLQVVANGIASDPVTFFGPVWVDFTFSAIGENGSYSIPFSALTQGTNAVASYGTIAIKGPRINASSGPAASHETMTISKPMTITAVGGSATIGH